MPYNLSWPTAVSICYEASIGNRMGWRLPAFEELATLVDPDTLSLPAGHPFTDTDHVFWAITSSPVFPEIREGLNLADRSLPLRLPRELNQSQRAWCIRGGLGHNPRPCSPYC